MAKKVGNITFDHDIIRAVSEKTGFTEEQVEVVSNFLFGHYFKQRLKDPDVYSVRLPYIGYLYIRTSHVKYFAEAKLNSGPLSRRKKDAVKNLLKKAEKMEKIVESMRTEEGVPYCYHLKKSLFNTLSNSFTVGKSFLEEKQNHDPYNR